MCYQLNFRLRRERVKRAREITGDTSRGIIDVCSNFRGTEQSCCIRVIGNGGRGGRSSRRKNCLRHCCS